MIGIHRVVIVLVAVASAMAWDEDSPPENLRIVNPFLCAPGSRFKVDCNFCKCVPQGGTVGACTRIACPLKPGECIPGTYFEVRGKLCPCPENRYKWDSNCFGR